jgi:3-methyladenine DNA glycosylase AlkD
VKRLALSSLVKLRNFPLKNSQWLHVQLILDSLWGNQEHYIVKGISWALRELSKSNEAIIAGYLEDKLEKTTLPKKYGRRFVVESIKKLSKNQQEKILRLL